MSNNKETSSPALKRSWFQELKTEFGKINWPSKQSLKRRSIAVIIIAVILGFLIAGIDWLLQIGLSYIVG
ncbi:MAG: preprotein translocase subunit SecE [Eubacteriales bacterium]|nr:preprotein translocase subunit SecE [Lachnospiraceae bacterium]MDO5126766.1 preprotein translocase subunit SecE [Eubacteriales bacterium]